MEKIKVLMTGYEAAPFYKRGGLGDVLGSLPKALSTLGIDVSLVIPYYKNIQEERPQKKVGTFSVCFGKDIEHIGIYHGQFPATSVPVYFLENKKYLSVIHRQNRNKKIDQFAFFDLAVAHFVFYFLMKGESLPDIIHCNDWHTGLIPLLLLSQLKISIPTLLTIHNLAYQGKGSRRVLDLLHVKDKDAKELRRGTPATEINILGEAIMHASVVSTVSPTYAKEIISNKKYDPINAYLAKRQKERGKHDGIVSILNGIDYDVWNPKRDPLISAPYDAQNYFSGKEKNKQALLHFYKLKDKITFCFIGRIAPQKGLDLLVKIIPEFAFLDVNLIILGSGEKRIENAILHAIKDYPNNIRAEFAYNEELAHKLYAGSDFILIPSHFEPCGLIQMIAMRYGTIPIASKTGGLADTIAHGENGFLFTNGSSTDLVKKIKEAVTLYTDKPTLEKMVRHALTTDFSWEKSAKEYKQLYSSLLQLPKRSG